MTFKKILIANRGEIAMRIAHAAADMGIKTLMLYTPDDATSRHRLIGDEVIALDGLGAAPFLDGAALIELAQKHRCDAIHPGYGLLSENAEFAALCEKTNICFIGAPSEILAKLGDKAAARALAQELDIPIIEGCDDIAHAETFFDRLDGAPLLIKAAAGGGGRGMRVVTDKATLAPALEQAAQEAERYFSDNRVYVERYLPELRHIEVQIIGDGKCVTHLWERDCSLQRRHQKIIEIAPAPHLPAAIRAKMLEAAEKLAYAVNYQGLGTVEFLLTPKNEFFFIECNPRLQVEHCISEEITGVDLVQTQIALAQGASCADLGLSTPPDIHGQAIELRICSEDILPDASIRPKSGTLTSFAPPTGRNIRLESHMGVGTKTNPHFDSLMAKLIIRDAGDNHTKFIKKACRTAALFEVKGVETNLNFLHALLAQKDCAQWNVHTRYIEDNIGQILQHRSLIQKGHEDARDQNIIKTITAPPHTHEITAPLQAQLLDINVAEGDYVCAGAELIVFEAMKMHHVVNAPMSGYIRLIAAEIGDVVDEGAPLLFIEPDDAAQDKAGDAEPIDLDYIRPDLAALNMRLEKTLDNARPEKVEKRHQQGNRTARENVEDLCDADSFLEYGQLVVAAQRSRRDMDDLIANTPADGLVAGFGSVNGDLFEEPHARTAVLAYDYTVLAGTQGAFNHKKTDRVLELASEWRVPSVFFTEGGGGRPGDTDFNKIQAATLDVMTFATYAAASATAPRIAVNNGRCFAGNAVLFGTADVTIATQNSSIGMGGPAMIEGGGLGVYAPDEVGPMDVQSKNGVVDILVADEAEAVTQTKKLLSYFQGTQPGWTCIDQRHLRHIIPEDRKRVYDIRAVISALGDTDSFLELRPHYGIGMITGFMRIEGKAFGVIANNPHHLGGAIDAEAAEKAARFMQLCDAFDVPLMSLCDTPGFMVGPEHEKRATVRRASSMLVIGASLSVPVFMICLRKGYGLGAQAMAMGSFHVPNFTISWPTGEFGPMGLEGAVQLGYRKELDSQETPEARDALYQKLVNAFYENGKALSVATFHEIDAVIDPKDTRHWLLRGLATMPVGKKAKPVKRNFIDVW